jgi:RNA polymerase sigma factor (sigma-70 family)
VDDAVIRQRLLALCGSGRLMRYALSRTGNPDDAEDLVQQTLTRAWERRSQATDKGFDGWVFMICRNIWNDELRRRRATPVGPGPIETAAAPDGDPAGPLEYRDILAFPAELVRRLREAGEGLLARFVEEGMACGFQPAEWAERMGFSTPGSVRAYLSRLRRWCESSDLKAEHYLGVLAAIAWALGADSAARAAGPDVPALAKPTLANSVQAIFDDFRARLPDLIRQAIQYMIDVLKVKDQLGEPEASTRAMQQLRTIVAGRTRAEALLAIVREYTGGPSGQRADPPFDTILWSVVSEEPPSVKLETFRAAWNRHPAGDLRGEGRIPLPGVVLHHLARVRPFVMETFEDCLREAQLIEQ